MEAVFHAIDQLNETYISLWEDICNLESPSVDKAAVDQVGLYFANHAKKLGWQVEILPQERFGDLVFITMNPDATLPPVALSGHMDTVHPIGSFGTPAVHREGNRICGPGVIDCKGGLVAGLLAMDALRLQGYRERPVMLLLQSNEEIGSGLDCKDTIAQICKKAENAVAFLNLEGHEDYFAGKACLVRKGVAGFRFTVTGVEAHASRCAKEGASAIAEAAHKILEIERLKSHDGATCNCGLISGGTATNTVPGACQFHVDVRFPDQKTYDETATQLQQIADEVYLPGCSCRMELTNLRPAMELTQRNTGLLAKANELFEACGLSRLEIGKRTGGSDAADVTVYGIPCIDSIGVAGERIHSREEYALVDSLAESAKRLAAIICGI